VLTARTFSGKDMTVEMVKTLGETSADRKEITADMEYSSWSGPIRREIAG